MTEHDDDRELSPDQEAHVRRLLADARHDEPTPDHVVARLDRVLADLAGEPARTATVVRLADRRRRAATFLVAAAASVAAVIGVGQLISTTDVAGGDAESSAAEAPAADVEEPEGVAGAEGGARGLVEQNRVAPYSVQSDDFARDADALQSTASALMDGAYVNRDYNQESAEEELDGDLSRVRGRTVCEPGAWGQGGYVAVVYDGAEGWVVLRRPQGDTQIVDLFLCGSEAVVRSVTLPYP